jgi:hypothetical protein
MVPRSSRAEQAEQTEAVVAYVQDHPRLIEVDGRGEPASSRERDRPEHVRSIVQRGLRMKDQVSRILHRDVDRAFRFTLDIEVVSNDRDRIRRADGALCRESRRSMPLDGVVLQYQARVRTEDGQVPALGELDRVEAVVPSLQNGWLAVIPLVVDP